jgi:hypothetical protein
MENVGYIARQFGIFLVVRYFLGQMFGIFPVLVYCTRKHLSTLTPPHLFGMYAWYVEQSS